MKFKTLVHADRCGITFDKMQHYFLIKTLNAVTVEGRYFNISHI